MTAAAAEAGTIVSVNTSLEKGRVKVPATFVDLLAGRGIEGDAHKDFAHRQVSLLAIEDIEAAQRRLGSSPAVPLGPGAFAENMTTRGLDLAGLAVGDELAIGETVRLRVTQIGKECHARCAVYELTGDCIMPVRGIFCEVLAGGIVRPGDAVAKR